MKALLPLLLLGIAIHLVAQQTNKTEKALDSFRAPKPFVALPAAGFKSLEEMKSYASSSLHGGGSVQEMTIGGQPVWLLRRSVALGGSTAEITFFKKTESGYVAFFGMPMSMGEFHVEQLKGGVLVICRNGCVVPIDKRTNISISIENGEIANSR